MCGAPLQVRWAVLNAVALLRAHSKAHDALAAAMQRGEPVRNETTCHKFTTPSHRPMASLQSQ